MGACPTLHTERLTLRPFREGDLDAYTALLQAPEVRASLHLPDDVGREHAWPRRGAAAVSARGRAWRRGSDSGSCGARGNGRSRSVRRECSWGAPDRTGPSAPTGPASRSAGGLRPTLWAGATPPQPG